MGLGVRRAQNMVGLPSWKSIGSYWCTGRLVGNSKDPVSFYEPRSRSISANRSRKHDAAKAFGDQ